MTVPGAGGQHHQPHDRAAGDRGAVLAHPNLGVEEPGGLDEPGRGARMQPALIADRRDAADRPGRRARIRIGRSSAGRRSSARVGQQLRGDVDVFAPGLLRAEHARSRLSLWRRLASLISIGRLMPAITSILARSMTEIARFDGRAAEHVGQQHHAVAGIDFGDRAQDVLAALLHVVFGADADGGDLRLRPDDMLERGDEFRREPPVGDQNHSDHRFPLLGRTAAVSSR